MPGTRAFCLLGVALAASSALAQEEKPVVLHYDAQAEAGCPSEAEFVALVQGRVPGLTRAAEGASVPTLRLRLAAHDAEFTAELELADRAGETSTRTISAASCLEAGEAAALIAAVFVSAPEPAPEVAPAATLTPASTPEESEATAIEAAQKRWALSVALRGGVRSAVTPGAAPALATSLELAREARGVWAPSLRVGGGYARGSASTPAGTLTLSAALAELDLCPLRVTLGPRWSLRSCARFEAGRHWGRWRSGATDARGGPWLAPGLGARLSAKLVGCATAELELGAAFPLVRNRFVHGEAAVFSVPSASFGGSLGVGCTIW